MVAASPGIGATLSVGRRYVEEAAGATAGLSSGDLRHGLTRLANSLLDGLPG
jgi:hypothetical protein